MVVGLGGGTSRCRCDLSRGNSMGSDGVIGKVGTTTTTTTITTTTVTYREKPPWFRLFLQPLGHLDASNNGLLMTLEESELGHIESFDCLKPFVL